jgi:DNA-binding NarL/FixJ family response regulator
MARLPARRGRRTAGPARISVGVAAADDGQLRRIAAALKDGGLTVGVRAAAPRQLATQAKNGKKPDVVVLTCRPTGSNGLEPLRVLGERLPDAPVVVVSPPLGGSVVRRVLEGGAGGIVFESDLEEALAATVRAVQAGQVSVPRQARQHLERPALSYREKQILGMVVMGFTNSEIARKLHLAESTVKSHLSSAFAKLGVRSRNEAAALILDPEAALGPGILAISASEAGAGRTAGVAS